MLKIYVNRRPPDAPSFVETITGHTSALRATAYPVMKKSASFRRPHLLSLIALGCIPTLFSAQYINYSLNISCPINYCIGILFLGYGILLDFLFFKRIITMNVPVVPHRNVLSAMLFVGVALLCGDAIFFSMRKPWLLWAAYGLYVVSTGYKVYHGCRQGCKRYCAYQLGGVVPVGILLYLINLM